MYILLNYFICFGHEDCENSLSDEKFINFFFIFEILELDFFYSDLSKINKFLR